MGQKENENIHLSKKNENSILKMLFESVTYKKNISYNTFYFLI